MLVGQQTISRTYLPQVNASLLQNGSVLSASESFGAEYEITKILPLNKFRGKIVAKGVDVSFPTQDFFIFVGENEVSIQNQSKDFFPQIRFITDRVFSEIIIETGLSNSNFVDSDLNYTRLFYSLLKSDSIVLRSSKGEKLLELKLTGDFEKLLEDVKHRAKIFRKLKFIEEFFNTRFFIPSGITPDEVRVIETVYRGITEGHFSISAGNFITIPNYSFQESFLKKPPFSHNGTFIHTFESEEVGLFGKRLSAGHISIRIEKAGIANQRAIRGLQNGDIFDLKLIVFDQQIQHFFLKYDTKEKLSRNLQKLRVFKESLREKEPDSLVSLLDEPLAKINSESALQKVLGWLQFHDFPDRYSAKDPILEETQWRVPVWLTYPNGKGVWLEDVLIGLRTGVIDSPISVEELRKKGKAKAKEVLSIA